LPAPHLYQTFRHSGQARTREATFQTLHEAHLPGKRLIRFAECGTHAYIQIAQDTTFHVRVTCNRCKDRWCEACQRELRIKLCLNLLDQLPAGRIRFLTLTRKHSGRTLQEQIDDLYRCWRNFRNRKAIKKALTGGITFLELKPSEATALWHVHLHILFSGTYIAKEVISREWHAATGDSFVIDIRTVGDKAKATGYVTKYATKLLPANVRFDKRRFLEVVLALEGRRIMTTFGTWSKLGLHKSKPSDLAWQTYGEFQAVLTAAGNGDVIAKDILAHLTLCSTLANNAVIFDEPADYHDPAP
jgi:hypothetical protein